MLTIAVALLLASGQTVFADGAWASFDRGASCQAVSRAQRTASNRAEQAFAGFTFDRAGPRRGQFAARLSRPLRPGATVIVSVGQQPFLLAANGRLAWSRGAAQDAAIIAAARRATGMRIEGRSPQGGRFVDGYLLEGAPGAIDAAAACASRR